LTVASSPPDRRPCYHGGYSSPIIPAPYVATIISYFAILGRQTQYVCYYQYQPSLFFFFALY
ncbi:hypothetical protein ACJX0J_022294, partial [Zea mays]